MILLWPIVAIIIFKLTSLEKAILWSVLLAYVLLPVRTVIELPGFPDLDKTTVPSITIFILCWLRSKQIHFFPSDYVGRIFLILILIFPILTTFSNSDTLYYGGGLVIGGLKPTELFSDLSFNIITFIFPFILGRQFLHTDEAHRDLLRILVIIGLIYTFPILWEIRMSPQLHTIIYGFFPHIWTQQERLGGYRAMVFLGHGATVGFFMLIVFLSAIMLWKKKYKPLSKAGFFIIAYLVIILVLCKTLAALISAIVIAPVIRFLGVKTHVKIGLFLALFVFTFPWLRASNVFQVEPILNFFVSIDAERAQSLEYRFNNEDILLEKAYKRKAFGWGSWGRNRVYDPETGEDISVTDGLWIIILGTYGFMGYITIYGFLCYPIFFLYRRANATNFKGMTVYSSGLCLMFAVMLVDTLPNASISIFTILIAGALYGRAENLKQETEVPKKTGRL